MRDFNTIAKEKVKTACHLYFNDKKIDFIIERCDNTDIPMLGVNRNSLSDKHTIISEYYNVFPQSDSLVMVNAEIELHNIDKNEQLRANCTFLCMKNKNDIIFKSIHFSYDCNRNQFIYTHDVNNYYEKAINCMYDVVLVYDMIGNIFKYDSYKYKELFQVDTHFVNMDQWFWHMCTECILPEDGEKMDLFRSSDIEKRIQNKQFVIEQEIRIKNKEFDYIWVKIEVVFIPNINAHRIDKLVILFKNIHEKKVQDMKTLAIARKDSLTNIWNRYYTEQLVNEYFETNSGLFSVFVVLDIDNFKKVNDTYGHITGDYVLRNFAKNILARLDKQDIFGRIGGDEFVLLLTSYKDKTNAMEKIMQILESANIRYSENGIDMDIHCSAGITVGKGLNCKFNSLYRLADKALYDAKKSGKNNYKLL